MIVAAPSMATSPFHNTPSQSNRNTSIYPPSPSSVGKEIISQENKDDDDDDDDDDGQ